MSNLIFICSILSLTELESLDLSINSLHSLPDRLCELRTLKRLDLRECGLRRFPERWVISTIVSPHHTLSLWDCLFWWACFINHIVILEWYISVLSLGDLFSGFHIWLCLAYRLFIMQEVKRKRSSLKFILIWLFNEIHFLISTLKHHYIECNLRDPHNVAFVTYCDKLLRPWQSFGEDGFSGSNLVS